MIEFTAAEFFTTFMLAGIAVMGFLHSRAQVSRRRFY